jgi:hypothetical protein
VPRTNRGMEFMLYPRVIHILKINYVWNREIFTNEFNKAKTQM